MVAESTQMDVNNLKGVRSVVSRTFKNKEETYERQK
jgi:hypothetical protein